MQALRPHETEAGRGSKLSLSAAAASDIAIIKWVLIVGLVLNALAILGCAIIVLPPVLALVAEASAAAQSAGALVGDARIPAMVGRADAIIASVSAGVDLATNASSALLGNDTLADIAALRSLLAAARRGSAALSGLADTVDPLAVLAWMQHERLLDKSIFLINVADAAVRDNLALFRAANLTGVLAGLSDIVDNLEGVLTHLQRDGITVKL